MTGGVFVPHLTEFLFELCEELLANFVVGTQFNGASLFVDGRLHDCAGLVNLTEPMERFGLIAKRVDQEHSVDGHLRKGAQSRSEKD